jgi:cytochrome bd-type quinol oxidase subunit 2
MLDTVKTLFQNTQIQFQNVDSKYITLTQDVISIVFFILMLTMILSGLMLLMYGKEDEIRQRTLRSLLIMGIFIGVCILLKVVLFLIY